MMRVFYVVLILLVSFFFLMGPAHAEYTFVFDEANYTVAPGATVDVYVSLMETSTSNLHDVGMGGAGIKVRWDEGMPADPAAVLADADVVNVSGFELVWNSSKAHPAEYNADLSLGTFDTVYGEETSPGSGIYAVALCKFIFTGGATPGITHIRATDYGTEDDNVLMDFTILDSLIADAQATITTIPEPSTFLLGGIAALALFAFNRGWRRRKTSGAAA